MESSKLEECTLWGGWILCLWPEKGDPNPTTLLVSSVERQNMKTIYFMLRNGYGKRIWTKPGTAPRLKSCTALNYG